MTINRALWEPSFRNWPSWQCPSCQAGTLALDRATLHNVETGPSVNAHSHDAWEPDWITERFCGLLKCQNLSCGEIVAVGGHTAIREHIDYERHEQTFETAFEPTFLSPAPNIIPLPPECPNAVSTELSKAFSLFWSDVDASANRLRVAVEALLTDRKVPRSKVSSSGKRNQLTLHARIEIFKQKDPTSADYLLAIKWLGNAGSHAGLNNIDRSDILYGFELIDHVIQRIYVRREQHLAKVAKRINSRKGKPVKKRVRWR